MMHADTLEYPDHYQAGPEGREAVAHEWKGDAGNRHKADIHTDIQERLKEDDARDAHGNALAKLIARNLSDLEASP